MKKFTFNLESLLTLRDWEEQNARAYLSEANAEVQRIGQQIEQLQVNVEGAFGSWDGAGGRRFTPSDRLSLSSQIAHLEKETTHARSLLTEAEQKRNQAMRALQKATRNRKAISSLKDKRLLEHRVEVERQERIEIEDLFNARRRAS